MTIYRSYFSKNNTLISGNKTNNAKNPVCEISYGTVDKELSRYLFDVDLSLLKDRINNGIINANNIVSHTLNMINTIRFSEEYVGKKSYNSSINRASNFSLDLFKVNEEWDEGTSYDFIYGINYFNNTIEQESNWVNRKLNTPWANTGAYSANTNTIIGSQYFRNGSENININVTAVINTNLSGNTQNNGFGIKFQDIYENTETNLREAVDFHSKYTNTVYEPYIETVIDDVITDDRNFFYLDKENSLYLYSPDNITINSVTIYDYEDNIFSVISGSSIINVGKGVNKISLTIDSDVYPDAVIFRDVWNITINGKTKNINNMFYLISQDNYFNFNNQINFDNYFFSFQGIKERESISNNHFRKIKILIKELYPNQNNFKPLDVEYRIFSTVAHKYEIEYIPFSKVNRTNYGYEFNLDTSWLIPQDYKIQIRLKNGDYYENKETLNFRIVSDLNTIRQTTIPVTTSYVGTTTSYAPTTIYISTTSYIPTTTISGTYFYGYTVKSVEPNFNDYTSLNLIFNESYQLNTMIVDSYNYVYIIVPVIYKLNIYDENNIIINDEFDLNILTLNNQTYNRYKLKNVYYSGYEQIFRLVLILNQDIVTTTTYMPTTTSFIPTTSVYIPTTSLYAPTTTSYVITTTNYIPTTTDYTITTTIYIPTTTLYVAPTTTSYLATTTIYIPSTTIYVPTTTVYTPTTTVYIAPPEMSNLMYSRINNNSYNISGTLNTNGSDALLYLEYGVGSEYGNVIDITSGTTVNGTNINISTNIIL